MEADARDLIDRAALASGRKRSDFVLEAARRAAEAALLDRTTIVVSHAAFDQFQVQLDAQAKPNVRLCKTAEGQTLPLSAPGLLTERHDVSSFSCGVTWLDDWLKGRQHVVQANAASWTFVLANRDQVAGFYTLSPGVVAIESGNLPTPKPIPIMTLGRLAIDSSQQHRGLSRVLFRDVVLRALKGAETGGIRAILAPAISTEAKNFYLALGLEPSLLDPMLLMVTTANARVAFQ